MIITQQVFYICRIRTQALFYAMARGPGPLLVAAQNFEVFSPFFVTDIVFVMTVCNFCISFRMRMINSKLI